MPTTAIAGRIGWERGLTVLKGGCGSLAAGVFAAGSDEPDGACGRGDRAVRSVVPVGDNPGGGAGSC
jgi:hypothetical protein